VFALNGEGFTNPDTNSRYDLVLHGKAEIPLNDLRLMGMPIPISNTFFSAAIQLGRNPSPDYRRIRWFKLESTIEPISLTWQAAYFDRSDYNNSWGWYINGLYQINQSLCLTGRILRRTHNHRIVAANGLVAKGGLEVTVGAEWSYKSVTARPNLIFNEDYQPEITCILQIALFNGTE